MPAPAPPTAAALRAAFAPPGPVTVGLEEELMLLDPETLDLAPRAVEALRTLGDDERFKLELPAAQLEIVTGAHPRVGDAARELLAARRALVQGLSGSLRVAGAGVHPFAAGLGVLNRGPRYEAILEEYASVARRQLVFGLHVHVAVRGPERALAVYNALRGFLPELAALAGNAPFYEGRDSGLASVRPPLSGLLPRQGVPPALPDWQAYAAALRWGAASGRFPDPRQWWWELRLHPVYGTLEVRVPDTQSTVADTAAVAAVVHALASWLAARHDAGEALPVAPDWRIAENRWSALRHGVEADLADLDTGEPRPARERLGALLDALEGEAAARDCAAELADARGLVRANGAARQRALAAEHGVHGLVARLADAFAPGGVSTANDPG